MSKLIKEIKINEDNKSGIIVDCFGNEINVYSYYYNDIKKLKDEMLVDKIEKTFEIK